MKSAAATLVDRFWESAASHADSLAIADSAHRISYRQLSELVDKVGGYLLSTGLQKGDRVAMVVANSAEYAGIFYGIWAAGGVTVALNTQAKARDIFNWVTHSDARWLFIDHNHPERKAIAEAGAGLTLVDVGGEEAGDAKDRRVAWQEVLECDASGPQIELRQTDLASIIYTSGTTGHPKGVTLSHGNLYANIESILAYLELSAGDSILNVLPFYYSYGNSILHTHLTIGAALILENSLLYPHRVMEKMAAEAVSGFSGVPSTFALLLSRVNLEDYDLSKLRYITQAGGAMAPALADRLATALPHTELFIMYGQTEASARLTYLPPSMLDKKRGSIGKAIANTTIEVRNKAGEIAAPGETGEICAHGDNIMQGYWKDEEKTDQVLKDGWLYTGDLAHTDSDGYLYIDGRSSDMIKSGANRISPKEIEEVIQEIADVQEVAVVGSPDELLGEVIKAYVVPKKGSDLKQMTIQHHCKNNLAIYKIPKSIEFIEELPKTASGKIQKFMLK
ncbi:MAG: acyl--CoA ligase [Candidatus Thiodiazotropha sp. (ex Ctena orbiculata)]|uniref:Acyl--CoA ligase n=1 Tax=Candidatus Thiodiazotropha taylori TaxID=2792791 RepID=A0A944QWN1_9GAMM|nr:acyl--CoA ligase [Candidatus Thiodiazotropha taylori]MBV2139030.1 acyl--CoA ligase [Candidatus Thiodiazotropha taylori]